MEDKCIICGAVIPEGRQICRSCEVKAHDPVVVDDRGVFRWNGVRNHDDCDHECK